MISSGTMPPFFEEALKSVTTDTKGRTKCTKRSHSLKRFAVQTLQEHLSPHSFVARCGFLAKNIHTMFDYFVNSATQDHKSTKVLGNWLHSMEGEIQGGIPPDSSAIKTAAHKVKPFIHTLFRT